MRFWNGVVAARIKRVTGKKPACRQPKATAYPVDPDSLRRIAGATWIKTAMRAQQGADEAAVELDKCNQESLHRISLCQ